MESATGIRSAVGWRKVEDVVELMEAELILGNGSAGRARPDGGVGEAHGRGAREAPVA